MKRTLPAVLLLLQLFSHSKAHFLGPKERAVELDDFCLGTGYISGNQNQVL